MDSKSVIARFEAERQALALMNHPNIAKVLDAGTTDTGRPYFVMELVQSIQITEYCDQKKLNIRERLELFVQVCRAIQHAHQKGIIHRDVKPSNVMVTEQDGKSVPKVIDFGVAKALSQRLTEKTIYTNFQAIVGTPLYMSPEQAALSNVDVDTRSDVYSLGVLLYELLTSTTPFDKQQFEQAAYDEIRRIIREEEPPKASTRISSLGATATIIAEHRKTDLHGLQKTVCGDLDWILMKALEKDRTRRYEASSALSADVQRFMNSEPIEARPPSTSYQLQKLYQRNKALVSSIAVIFLAFTIGLAGAIWGVTKQNQALQELRVLSMDSAFNAALAGDLERVNEMTEFARRAGESQDRIVVALALADLFSGESGNAIERLETLNETQESLTSNAVLSIAYFWNGQVRRSELTLQRLKSFPVNDDYDLALKAFARNARWEGGARTDPELEAIVDKHKNWAMARWWYALNLFNHAQDRGNLGMAVHAAEQAELAAVSLPKESVARTVPVMTNHLAYLLAREAGDDKKSEQFHSQCKQAIELLPGNMMQFAGWFFDDEGSVNAALRYWKIWDDANHKQASVRRASYISCLLRAEDVATAENVLLHDPDDDWARLNQCLVAAFKGRNQEVIEICNELVNKASVEPRARSLILALLWLSGETDKAQTTADQWLSTKVVGTNEFEERIWKLFGSQEFSERDLLKGAGESRFDQCRAHFYVGVRFLGKNETVEAEASLRSSSKLGVFSTLEIQWARMLLHKLDSQN